MNNAKIVLPIVAMASPMLGGDCDALLDVAAGGGHYTEPPPWQGKRWGRDCGRGRMGTKYAGTNRTKPKHKHKKRK
jgi:hypothetical protein